MVLHVVIPLPSSSSVPQNKIFVQTERGTESADHHFLLTLAFVAASAFLPLLLFLPYLIPLASQCEDRFVLLGSSAGRPETEVQVERRTSLTKHVQVRACRVAAFAFHAAQEIIILL